MSTARRVGAAIIAGILLFGIHLELVNASAGVIQLQSTDFLAYDDSSFTNYSMPSRGDKLEKVNATPFGDSQRQWPSWCNQSQFNDTISSGRQPAIDNNNDSGNSPCLSSNDTSNHTLAGSISFTLPVWRQVLWNLLFGFMVVVATGGNLIVVWIVVTTKRMRTVTNYFIVNLSIADCMVSSLNVTFSYIYMLDNDWPFGDLYCKVSQFIATLSISASVFTLMAISIDRYVAIMKPLQPRMSKRCNLAIAALIWSSSTVISFPALAVFTTGEINTVDGVRTVCYQEWPDGTTNHSQMEYVYNIVFMLLTYFLPIISMTVTYTRVGLELWGSQAIGEYAPRQVENVRSKRRVVKMMVVVVVIFAVCWLPFHAYFIVTSCYPSITESDYIQEVYLAIYWLAMSNSMYNPIIYCWMNARFRYGFRRVFRWCPFVHTVGVEKLNRADNMTYRYSYSSSPDEHCRIKRRDTEKSILYSYHSYAGKGRNSLQYANANILRSSAQSFHGKRHSAPMGPLRNSDQWRSMSIAGNGGGGGVGGDGNTSHALTSRPQNCPASAAAMAAMSSTPRNVIS